MLLARLLWCTLWSDMGGDRIWGLLSDWSGKTSGKLEGCLFWKACLHLDLEWQQKWQSENVSVLDKTLTHKSHLHVYEDCYSLKLAWGTLTSHNPCHQCYPHSLGSCIGSWSRGLRRSVVSRSPQRQSGCPRTEWTAQWLYLLSKPPK